MPPDPVTRSRAREGEESESFLAADRDMAMGALGFTLGISGFWLIIRLHRTIDCRPE